MGAMHCKPEVLGEVLAVVKNHWSSEDDGPLCAYPDDIRVKQDKKAQGVLEHEPFGSYPVDQLIEHCLVWKRSYNVQVFGACCGFTASHIAALARSRLLQEEAGVVPPRPVKKAPGAMEAARAVSRSPRYRAVLAELKRKRTIVIDAAVATELKRVGVPMAVDSLGPERRFKPVWSALASETHQEQVIAMHEGYIRAGSRVITANTYSSTREILRHAGVEEKFELLNRRSVELALEARKRTKTEDSVLVAGSVSHTRPSQPGDWDPAGVRPVDWEEEMTEMVRLQKEAGVDLMLIEMAGDAVWTPCLIRACQVNEVPFWIGFSAKKRVVAKEDGKPFFLGFDAVKTPDEARAQEAELLCYNNAESPLADALPGLIVCAGPAGLGGCDVVGVNHCKIQVLGDVLSLVRQHGWDGPLLAYPDDIRLAPKPLKGGLVNSDPTLYGSYPTERFVEYCFAWRQSYGVSVFGGCCGFTTPQIAALTERLRKEEHSQSQARASNGSTTVVAERKSKGGGGFMKVVWGIIVILFVVYFLRRKR